MAESPKVRLHLSMFVRWCWVECDAVVAGGPHSYNGAPQEGLSNGLKGVNTGG